MSEKNLHKVSFVILNLALLYANKLKIKICAGGRGPQPAIRRHGCHGRDPTAIGWIRNISKAVVPNDDATRVHICIHIRLANVYYCHAAAALVFGTGTQLFRHRTQVSLYSFDWVKTQRHLFNETEIRRTLRELLFCHLLVHQTLNWKSYISDEIFQSQELQQVKTGTAVVCMTPTGPRSW